MEIVTAEECEGIKVELCIPPDDTGWINRLISSYQQMAKLLDVECSCAMSCQCKYDERAALLRQYKGESK